MQLQKGQDLSLNRVQGGIFELGLSWDFFPGMDPVDLDAAAVLFDNMGQVVDAAFYKQL